MIIQIIKKKLICPKKKILIRRKQNTKKKKKERIKIVESSDFINQNKKTENVSKIIPQKEK